MHVPEWKLGQGPLWLVSLNCPVWRLESVPPVSWRRFWAIYGLRTSGMKSVPLLATLQPPILSLRTDVPIPAVSHICPAVTLHLPSLGARKPPKHFATRAGQGKLCVPAPVPITAISPGMSYPRERRKILGRMFTVLISGLQGITRLT